MLVRRAQEEVNGTRTSGLEVSRWCESRQQPTAGGEVYEVCRPAKRGVVSRARGCRAGHVDAEAGRLACEAYTNEWHRGRPSEAALSLPLNSDRIDGDGLPVAARITVDTATQPQQRRPWWGVPRPACPRAGPRARMTVSCVLKAARKGPTCALSSSAGAPGARAPRAPMCSFKSTTTTSAHLDVVRLSCLLCPILACLSCFLSRWSGPSEVGIGLHAAMSAFLSALRRSELWRRLVAGAAKCNR